MAETETMGHLVTERHRCAIAQPRRRCRQVQLAYQLAGGGIPFQDGEARGLALRLPAVTMRRTPKLRGRYPVNVHGDLGDSRQRVPALGPGRRVVREQQKRDRRGSPDGVAAEQLLERRRMHGSNAASLPFPSDPGRRDASNRTPRPARPRRSDPCGGRRDVGDAPPLRRPGVHKMIPCSRSATSSQRFTQRSRAQRRAPWRGCEANLKFF